MGDKADDILASFALSADERKKYTTVKEKFDRYFVKKHNIIFERTKFNSRRQRKGETVDNFITDLHCLAEHCAYGELHSEMIHDRIVVGLLEDGLSEKMQLDPNLTLEKAVSMACQSEAVPSWPNLTEFRKVDKQYKKKQKSQCDKRHRARELPEFDDNTNVFITDGRNPTVPGRVIRSSGTRSYIVETPTGTSHRNRSHLHQRPSDTSDIARPIEPRSPVQTRSKTKTPKQTDLLKRGDVV